MACTTNTQYKQIKVGQQTDIPFRKSTTFYIENFIEYWNKLHVLEIVIFCGEK